jgi:hypothetical protein
MDYKCSFWGLYFIKIFQLQLLYQFQQPKVLFQYLQRWMSNTSSWKKGY